MIYFFTFPVVLFIAKFAFFKCPYFLNSLCSCNSENYSGKFPIYSLLLYLELSGAAFYYYDFYDFELEDFDPSVISYGGAALLFFYSFFIIWSPSCAEQNLLLLFEDFFFRF